MRRVLKRYMILTVLLAVAVGVTACDGEVGGGDDSSGLTSSHIGWLKADCVACHAPDGHNAGLTIGECVVCHSDNGAPAGHDGNTPCLACHSATGLEPAPAEHLDGDFLDPDDCDSCH